MKINIKQISILVKLVIIIIIMCTEKLQASGWLKASAFACNTSAKL